MAQGGEGGRGGGGVKGSQRGKTCRRRGKTRGGRYLCVTMQAYRSSYRSTKLIRWDHSHTHKTTFTHAHAHTHTHTHIHTCTTPLQNEPPDRSPRRGKQIEKRCRREAGPAALSSIKTAGNMGPLHRRSRALQHPCPPTANGVHHGQFGHRVAHL